MVSAAERLHYVWSLWTGVTMQCYTSTLDNQITCPHCQPQHGPYIHLSVTGLRQHQLCTTWAASMCPHTRVHQWSCVSLSIHLSLRQSVCVPVYDYVCPLCMLLHSRLTTKSSMTAKVPILHRKLTFYHRSSQLRYWHTTSGILCGSSRFGLDRAGALMFSSW